MELFEREGEREALRALAARAADGEGGCVVVAGGAGIGKTTLLRGLRDGGATYAVAGELEDDVPFGVVRDLLGPLLAAHHDPLPEAIALCAPVFDGAAVTPDAGAVLHGLYALVADAARRRPLTLVVDDVQWTDPASVRFLAYLVRRVADLPCLVVLGLRTDAHTRVRPEVLTLMRLLTVARIDLAPLSPGAVATLLDEILGTAVDDAFAGACHTATGGNPLLCVAVARECARWGVRGTAAEVAAAMEAGAAGVAGSVRHRVARCGPAAEDVARAVAILGRSASHRRVQVLAGCAVDAADSAVERLVAEGVLDDARPLAFTHPILRAAVLDDIPGWARARWHARAAQLTAADGLGEEAAHHLRQAEPLGDPAAVTVLRDAAAAALGRGAAEAAVAFLVRADEEPPPADQRAAVLYELGVAESYAGAGAAIAHLERARDLAADRELRVRIAAVLGDAQMWAGRWRDAVETIEEGIVAARDGTGVSPLHGQLLRASAGSATARRLTAGRLAALRGRVDFAPDEHAAMGFLAVELAMTGGPAARVADLAKRALGHDGLPGDPIEGLPELVATALALADEPVVAGRVFDAAIGVAEAAGRATTSARIRALRGWSALRFGRPVEAEADARAALALDDGAVVNAAARPLAIGTLIGAMLELCGPWAAREVADEYAAVDVDPDLVGEQPLPLARARLALAELRPEVALAELEVARRWEDGFAATSVGWVPWRPVAVEALLLLGDPAAAREAAGLAAEHLAQATAFGAGSVRGVALHAVARVERDAALLEEAVCVLRDAPAQTALVRALLDLGAMLRGDSRRVQARVPLREALDVAERVGAAALADRAREELRATGARLRRARISGAEALTPAEERMCRLAASGLTNRQIAEAGFVSPRTVEMHLSHAYRKLGIAGRAELAGVEGAWAEG